MLIDLRHHICLECNEYDKKNKQCLECGCDINRERTLFNKLAWKDQKCPLEKW